MATYRALTGLEYGDKRIEAGELVSDLPSKSVSWLLSQCLIEAVESEEPAKRSRKTVVEPEVTEEEEA